MSDTAPRNHAGLRALGVRHRVLRRWLPVVVWATLIFALSSVPDLGTGLGGWDTLLRKLAHAAEYGVLGALLLRAVRSAPVALTLGTLYAISDEAHQAFVPGRLGSPVDVAIDALGVAIGIAVWQRVPRPNLGVAHGRPIAIDLDGALGDTRPLWLAWIRSAAPLLGFDAAALPEDRAEAAAELDRRGAGNWRILLRRFGEERAPVYFRRDPGASAALRALAASGREIGVFTDAPEPLARLALAQLGAERRIAALEAGESALERLLERLGNDVVVVRTHDELVRAST